MADEIQDNDKAAQIRGNTSSGKQADSRQKAVDHAPTASVEAKHFDPFYKDDVFPEAGAVFSFQPASISDIKDNACVIVDTSALLLPYTGQLEKKSLDAIERMYTKLISEGRLVIPAQAAREFAHNRAKKVAEMYEEVSKRKDTLPRVGGTGFGLLESVDAYKKVIELESAVNAKLGEYKAAVDGLLRYINNWNWNDPISELYRRLFGNVPILEPAKERNDIKLDLLRRKTHSIPPGYKDPERDVGDLLIWHTILEVDRSRHTNVLFVSGDNKPDWRERANSGSVVLYPRYELLDEFRRESGGCTFQIIQFSELLNLYGESEEAVRDVKRVEEVAERVSFALSDTPYASMDNRQLRAKALHLVEELRGMIQHETKSEQALRLKHHAQTAGASTKRERENIGELQTLERIELMNSTQREYNARYKVDAMLLRDELLARLPTAPSSREDVDRWYEHGASGMFIEVVATDLEILARRLSAASTE